VGKAKNRETEEKKKRGREEDVK